MSVALDRIMTGATAVMAAMAAMAFVRFGGWPARDVQIAAMIIAVAAFVLSIALAASQKKSVHG